MHHSAGMILCSWKDRDRQGDIPSGAHRAFFLGWPGGVNMIFFEFQSVVPHRHSCVESACRVYRSRVLIGQPPRDTTTGQGEFRSRLH